MTASRPRPQRATIASMSSGRSSGSMSARRNADQFGGGAGVDAPVHECRCRETLLAQRGTADLLKGGAVLENGHDALSVHEIDAVPYDDGGGVEALLALLQENPDWFVELRSSTLPILSWLPKCDLVDLWVRGKQVIADAARERYLGDIYWA